MSVKTLLFLLITPLVLLQLQADEPVSLDPLHPSVLLTDNGPQSCSGCHDTRFIRQNSTHGRSGWEPGCIACHLKGGARAADGSEVRHLIQRPDIANCKACHPVSDERFREPLGLPDLYTRVRDMTQNSGAVYSPQAMSRSAMNLQGKQELTMAWDVHAQRHLACNDCHFTANDPRHCSVVRTDLDHLIRDPRRLKATSDYLRWPDHKLSTASCQCCHDPLKSHTSFPYLVRHLESLECLSCHVPSIHTPAFQTIDETVITPDGQPRMELRGIQGSQAPKDGELNAAFIERQMPVLLSRPLAAMLADRLPIKTKDRLAPFNLVTRWYWFDEGTNKPLSVEIVSSAYRSGDGYDAAVLAALDRDGDRLLSSEELWLDTRERVDLIAERLKENGAVKPVIRGEVMPHAVNHGTVDGDWAVKTCAECHSREGRLAQTVVLTDNPPFGGKPVWGETVRVDANGRFEQDPGGNWVLRRSNLLPHHHVFGFSRVSGIDLFGWLLLLASLLGIAFHAGLRVYNRKNKANHEVPVRVEYLYPFYERLWHWLMALGIILLMVTGLEIHGPDALNLFGFAQAVFIHNIVAVIVVVNGALSLLYHLFSGEIRQFFGFNRAFIREMRQQVFYYLLGIFKHKPHPVPKTRERKLNPLQQITYLLLLNLLLPFQVVTGILMWVKGQWPQLIKSAGLLNTLAPLHHAGSWLLIVFLVVHLYLITTGHRPLTNLRAMVTGFDELEDHRGGKI
jgi:thiosulfate reductase cytochrome b subunit